MGGDRHSIIEAGTHMRMAVVTMEEVMRTAGRSELHRSGRLQIESDIRTLEEGCAGLKKLILMAAAALRDDWPEIERNARADFPSAPEPCIAREPGTLSDIPTVVRGLQRAFLCSRPEQKGFSPPGASPTELAVGSIKVLFYICGRNSPCDGVAFLIRTDRFWTSRLGLCLYFFDSGKTKIRVTGNIGVEIDGSGVKPCVYA